jgi:hypothetical protein
LNYLTPEIEALAKNMNGESLVRPTISCGIFQDYDDNLQLPNPDKNEASL